MQLINLRRPLQAAAVNSCRAQATAAPACSLSERFALLRLDVGHSSTGIGGRRWASVKSQGAYKLTNKKTIPKKLGAKRTGGMLWLWTPVIEIRGLVTDGSSQINM
jgi:large subunit ribosomal protein L27